jgi:hypothetical protein
MGEGGGRDRGCPALVAHGLNRHSDINSDIVELATAHGFGSVKDTSLFPRDHKRRRQE